MNFQKHYEQHILSYILLAGTWDENVVADMAQYERPQGKVNT
jgi:hypothetical protein